MRTEFTPLIQLRRMVFVEIAKMGYDDSKNLSINLEQAVYNILPGEVAKYRESIFKERAIVGERLRMGLGLKMRAQDEYSRLSDGCEEVIIDERIVQDSLIEVMPFACEACPTKTYRVTNNCRKCLAHPCIQVCPVNAISMGKYSTVIDEDKCIRCGKCKESCPYNAIVFFDRPCAAACGVNAIESDHLGRAHINQDKCVTCGMCLVNCPFGAIADKTEIFQLIQAIKSGEEVHAMLAPAFVGQFGPIVTPDMIKEGIRRLGFKSVVEVAIGADIESIHEAEEFIKEVPDTLEFLGTSCCPSWYLAATKNFPEFKKNISSSATPMVATAKYIKDEHKKAKVAFIGPCIAKKTEASQPHLRNHIDFVITFEELMGMLVAQNIDFASLKDAEKAKDDASTSGRGFASAGGVAQAIINTIHKAEPTFEVKTYNADGLHECMKMLKMAKAGKYKGYLLEGMGCPGGCIGGPGTLAPINKSGRELEKYKNASPYFTVQDNKNVKHDWIKREEV
ncbi:MAG: 4Fe-4S dicluster domain-containing protein [Peptoanaerobacter stomatis]|uniref:4Fe-4S dicluster domain-containing protein n=1 Tax=Peptoanaerobacter stomatis TaxID=796937 RepID=UPI003FA0A70F